MPNCNPSRALSPAGARRFPVPALAEKNYKRACTHTHAHAPCFLRSRKPSVNVSLPEKVRLFALSFLYLEVHAPRERTRGSWLLCAPPTCVWPGWRPGAGGRGPGRTREPGFSSWCSSPGSALGISHGLALAGKPGRRRRLWASPPPFLEPEPNSNRAPAPRASRSHLAQACRCWRLESSSKPGTPSPEHVQRDS